MADAYAMADIVALPSRSESFGYAALEALHSQKPVIMNNIPPYKEIGKGNPNAYYFDQTSIAFAEALHNLLTKNIKGIPNPKSWQNRYSMSDGWAADYEALLREAKKELLVSR